MPSKGHSSERSCANSGWCAIAAGSWLCARQSLSCDQRVQAIEADSKEDREIICQEVSCSRSLDCVCRLRLD